MVRLKLFSGGGSFFTVLINDCLNNTGKGCDRSVEYVANGGKENLSGRELSKSLDFIKTDYFAVKEAALYCECIAGFSVFAEDTGSRCIIVGAGCDGGGSRKNFGKAAKRSTLNSDVKQGVLNYGVLNAVFTKLFTELCIVGYANTAIVNKNACASAVKSLFELGNLLLFSF